MSSVDLTASASSALGLQHVPSSLAFCTGAGGPNVGLVLVTAHTLPIKLALQAPISHFFLLPC